MKSGRYYIFCITIIKSLKKLKFKKIIIIKSNEYFAENKIKNETEQLLLNISMETIFMNTEKNKKDESHKFVLNLSKRLDVRSSS